MKLCLITAGAEEKAEMKVPQTRESWCFFSSQTKGIKGFNNNQDLKSL